MSIDLIFDDAPGRRMAWDGAGAAKLEAALEILQRRYDLDVDRPTERQYIWHAIGGLWSVLRAATDDERYDQEHPAEVDPDDLPF